MRTLAIGFLALVALVLCILPACGSSKKGGGDSDLFTEQTACRTHLAGSPDTAEVFDVFVDVAGPEIFTVTVESGAGAWKALPGPLEEALLAAYGEAKAVGRPMRLVYGPGLADALKPSGVKAQAAGGSLEVKQTYYATTTQGCTEATPRLHQAEEGDCIRQGARECRVQLLDACEAATEPFLDVAFAWWDKGDVDAGAPEPCYGVMAQGAYAITLPASDICQCGAGTLSPKDLYARARDLLAAALHVRGMDQSLAHAIASGMATAALANQDQVK